MFKVPDWEEDTKKPSLSYVNNIKKQKRTKKKKVEVSKNDAPAKITVENKVVKNADLLPNGNNKTETIKIKSNIHDKHTLGNKLNKKKKKQIKTNKLSQSIKNIEMTVQNCNTENKKKNKLTKKKKPSESDNVDEMQIKNGDDDKLDEILLDARKRKFNDKFNNEDSEEIMFSQETSKKTKPENTQNSTTKKVINGVHTISKPNQVNRTFNKKKEIIKSMLNKASQRNHIEVNGNQLRERMLNRLKAAQFRYLNEKLYTSSGGEAQSLFQEDPLAFHTYHQGYQQQVKKWPVKPLDVIVKKILEMPKSHLVADMGCGEAALCARVPQRVRSFDLVAAHEGVEACDMAHTPLPAASVDVAVYCLALMGTDLTQYLLEANRVLKVGGHLLIAEVESRFEEAEGFAREVQRLGFKLRELDKQHQVFFFFHFSKVQQPPVKKSKLPHLTLKPCLYKKR
ncbi:PREDICTED: ribosomal RNA-processing protein 8-like [Papilio xuthus]|uniref:Ribosomal RNA-processing protein 8 n=1 Tax=Papilio xuthus TaxID=66420 RepID=A0AAJ6YYQ0_PAPXU|nr:PREDICTED: ribosomal RNA-processing protein 8-like [Papilio xuthus]